jgi:diaminopimelate decarboxylase
MEAFRYKNKDLFAEKVPVAALAKRYGTPLYVYSLNHVLDNYRSLDRAFRGLDHLICFSMKANSTLALLGALAKEGSGFDIVSGGELYRLQRAGADMGKVIFAGVGKTASEIEQAIRAGILMFNIESWPEAELINAIALRLKRRVKVDFRINPNVDAKTHAYISTGKKENKFGMPIYMAADLFSGARKLQNLDVTGIHLHIGSQITRMGPFVQAARKAVSLIRQLRQAGHVIHTLNLGGGIGILYDREKPITPAQFAKALIPLLAKERIRLLLEPGRFMVGNAGILVTEVQYIKESKWKDFVIVDAAMNDLIRPSFYDAYHEIVPVHRQSGGKKRRVDVVGPICESGDFLAKDRTMGLPSAGDLLALRSAGAYGFVMASNYNSRGRAAEILVDGSRVSVARRRETNADLVRGESVPAYLRPKSQKRTRP